MPSREHIYIQRVHLTNKVYNSLLCLSVCSERVEFLARDCMPQDVYGCLRPGLNCSLCLTQPGERYEEQ